MKQMQYIILRKIVLELCGIVSHGLAEIQNRNGLKK